MSRLLKKLPIDIRNLIRDYASDRVAPTPTARIMKHLRSCYYWDVPLKCSRCCGENGRQYFRKYNLGRNDWDPECFPEFTKDYFVRVQLQEFSIIAWMKGREQDNIEAMGVEDIRLYSTTMS